MHVQPRKTTNHSATDMLCDWVTIEKKLGHEQDYQTAQCVLHLEWSQAAWNADESCPGDPQTRVSVTHYHVTTTHFCP